MRPVDEGPTLFDQLFNNSEDPIGTQTYQPADQRQRAQSKPKTPVVNPEPIDFEYDEIDRPRIVNFINNLALPSYQVRPYQQNNYLNSLFALCRFLLISGLDVNAKESVICTIVERINKYISGLKHSGKYQAAKEKVENFEMFATVYDAFGEQIKAEPVRNMFSETDVDIERQLRIAERQLGKEGVAVAYGRK